MLLHQSQTLSFGLMKPDSCLDRCLGWESCSGEWDHVDILKNIQSRVRSSNKTETQNQGSGVARSELGSQSYPESVVGAQGPGPRSGTKLCPRAWTQETLVVRGQIILTTVCFCLFLVQQTSEMIRPHAGVVFVLWTHKL